MQSKCFHPIGLEFSHWLILTGGKWRMTIITSELRLWESAGISACACVSLPRKCPGRPWSQDEKLWDLVAWTHLAIYSKPRQLPTWRQSASADLKNYERKAINVHCCEPLVFWGSLSYNKNSVFGLSFLCLIACTSASFNLYHWNFPVYCSNVLLFPIT